MENTITLSVAQQYFVDLLRSHISHRITPAAGSSMVLPAHLGDMELWEDFRLGINYFNTLPPQLTVYTSQSLYNASQASENNGGEPGAPAVEDLTSILTTPVIMCALFYTGLRLQFFEAGKHFRFSDNGISIERAKQQDYANIVNGDILSYLTTTLPNIKKTLAFSNLHPHGLWSGNISMNSSIMRGLRGVRLGYGS